MRLVLLLTLSWAALASGVSAQGGSASRRARAEQLVAQGSSLFEAGDRVSAAGYFRDAIDADPSLGEAYVGLGRLELSRGRLSDAREVFEEGLAHAPDTLDLWLGAAEVQSASGDAPHARRLLARMVSRFQSSPRAHHERARFAERLFAWPEALAAYRALLSLAEGGTPVEAIWLDEARAHIAALTAIVGAADPLARCDASSSAVRIALCQSRP